MILPSKGSPNPQRSANAENKEAFNAGVNNSAGSAKNDKNKSKLHNYVQFLSTFFAQLLKRVESDSVLKQHFARISNILLAETLYPKVPLWCFASLKRGKYMWSFPSSTPSCICCASVVIVENNRTSQLWMEGRGVDCFALQSYPIWGWCLKNFVNNCMHKAVLYEKLW